MFLTAVSFYNPTIKRAKSLRDFLKKGDEISEAVNFFKIQDREHILVMLCLKSKNTISHLAWGRRGNTAGTQLIRLHFERIEEIDPIFVEDFLKEHNYREFFEEEFSFENFHESKDILTDLMEFSEEIREFVLRSMNDHALIDRLSPYERSIVRQEHDATEMSIRLANMLPRQTYIWSPTKQGKEEVASFFDGLQPNSIGEDDIVRWDLDKIPGFRVVDRKQFGYFRLQSTDVSLHIFHANKNKLENTLGVDLIYYNELHQNFVMVQYKKMFKDKENEESLYRPDAQLNKELERMDFITETLGIPQASSKSSDYRIIENPFFLKLCPYDNFDPDSYEQIRGMILSREQWACIEADTTLSGPKGGKIVTFKNCARYFDNTQFIANVRDGWIGTKSTCAEFLSECITQIINRGNSILLAAKLPNPKLDATELESPEKRKTRRGTKRV